MKELYFKADLNGLINELTKYHEINKVKQLILNLDTIHHLYHQNKSKREREILVKLLQYEKLLAPIISRLLFSLNSTFLILTFKYS